MSLYIARERDPAPGPSKGKGTSTMRAVRTLLAVVTLGGLAASSVYAQGDACPKIDDAALLKLYPTEDVHLPPRLMTPEVVARIRAGQPTLATDYPTMFGSSGAGQKCAAEIPETRWKDLIPPYAGFTIAVGGNVGSVSGQCPFCGKRYGGTAMTLEDFFAHPFQAKTKCCGATVYEHEADMPADYKARPNHVEKIPHLDGALFDYHFFVPSGEEKQGPELGSRGNWFCSASEVWWARASLFACGEGCYGIVPDLAAAVVQANDAKAARALAAIFDRLADVYPGYPLEGGATANALARSADGKHYLTREEYRATPVPCNDFPAWLRIPVYYNLGKMNHFCGWQDGVMLNAGDLAAVFDLIYDRPEVRAYSREHYNDENAWERRVRKGVVDELHLLGQISAPNRGGNTSYMWIAGALRLGLVTQDPWFVRTAIEMLDRVIDNHYYTDGLCCEGAFNYSGMVSFSLGQVISLRKNFGVDFTARHPLLPLIESRNQSSVVTLYGVESMHSDECAYFFSGSGGSWKVPPDKVNYPAHEVAQCDPFYGLACLRAGAPGSRLETIMDFQTSIAHTHSARLNLQVFYEGVNLLPDIGYAIGAVDVTKPPWSKVTYPFERLPLPLNEDSWGFWKYGYGDGPNVHCTALVDGEHSPAGPGPMAFQRFLGGCPADDPGYDAQCLNVDGRGLFKRRAQPVEVFQRQLVAVTLAGGRPLLLDFFRIRGGQRHDLLWHAPATAPDEKLETSLGEPKPLDGTFASILAKAPDGQKQVPDNDVRAIIRSIGRLGRWTMPDGAWQATFHVQPSKFSPVTEGGKKIYEPWMQVLHDVNLRLWGATLGSPADTREILCGRMPWPSKVHEVVDGAEIGGLVSLKDAFHFVAESRSAKASGLSTTYLHVLDPSNPNQAPAVEKMEAVAPEAEDKAAMGAGLRIALAAGQEAGDSAARTVWAATTADGGHFAGGGMTLNGRLGVCQPANRCLALFDGTRWGAAGFAVSLEPTWRMKLLGVIGDLTGNPGESALVVESSRPLPLDKALVGRMLTVYHKISSFHTSGYTIERVRPFGAGRYRIDLRNAPTFIVNRFTVRELDAKDPRWVKVDYWLLKGDNDKGPYDGRRVRLPKTGFETGMTLGPGQDGWHHNVIRLDEPPARSIHAGDPVIIYQIQPGDEVVIPSHFACKGTETDAGLKIEITTTGPATLTVPGDYRNARLLMGFTQAPVGRVQHGDGHLQVELRREDIADGRAVLLLTR